MSARSKSGPDVNRLLDIVVEEVSLVDHAANKHRFLIVKRSDEMDDTTTNPTAPADEPSAEGNPAAADEAKPTGETNNTDSASAKDEGGQDSSPLAVAVAALEGITEAVELLGNLDEDEARARLGELAGDLRGASQRLAEAAGTGAADHEGGEQDGAEPPKETPDLSSVLDAVRATLQRVAELIKEPPAAAGDLEPASEGDSGLAAQLTELVGELRSLTSTVKEQQQRLARLEKRFGLPNSAPSGERPTKPAEEDVGWPMDLNRPFDRESVDKATSFHDV
jgi:hypothetical protein